MPGRLSGGIVVPILGWNDLPAAYVALSFGDYIDHPNKIIQAED